MKVLLINGSPRKEGNTHVALQEVASQLHANGIETEVLSIGVKPVRGCIACGQCHAKNLGRCAFDDDLCNRAIEMLSKADGLIVASPVYYGQPNGTLVSLIQRMLYAGGANAQNKPVAVIAVCRRGGATSAIQTMAMPFQLLNMPIVTSQYWNIAYGREKGEAAQDAEGMQTMRTLANNMSWLLKNLHADHAEPAPAREERQSTHFIR